MFGNTEEEEQLIPQNSQIIARKKRYMIAFLIILSNLLESFTFYVLELKMFDVLANDYHWPENHVNYLSKTISIFLIYMGFLGGIIADFILPDWVLFLFSYITFIFGGLSLSLMKHNTFENYTQILPSWCSNKTVHSNDKTLECEAFSTSVFFIIGFGNGILLPILYSFSCHQIRIYGPKYISATMFLNHGFRNLGIFLAHFIVNYLESLTNIFIVYAFSTSVSFLFLLIAFKYGEYQSAKISFYTFLGHFKDIVFSVFKRCRKEAPGLVNSDYEENGNAPIILRMGVKRLLTYVFLICVLIFPACVLNRFIDLLNKQSLYMVIPEYLKSHLANANLNLMVNNLNTVNEICIIISSILLATFIIKRYSAGNVMSYYWRIFLGTMFAVIAFYYGGVIEHFRLLIFWGPNYDSLHHSTHVTKYIRDGKSFYVANLSAFFLCPSYILLGLSEILVLCTAFEYAYLHSPPWLRYTAVGLASIAWGSGPLGNYPFLTLNGVIYNQTDINYRRPCTYLNESLTEELHHVHRNVCWYSHLDYLYCIVASAMLVSFFIMLIIKHFIKPDRFYEPFWEQLTDRAIDEIPENRRELPDSRNLSNDFISF